MSEPRAEKPVGRRDLSRPHIMFYRAIMEGIEPQRAWQYIEIDGDYAHGLCEQSVQWIRQALISEALNAGKPEIIGLFRRDPRKIKVSNKPSLEEFAARFADAGSFSESEIQEWWLEEFGGDENAESGKKRLQQRLKDALDLLERSVHKTPKPTDSVGNWLTQGIAESLIAVGLTSLQDVSNALVIRSTARWDAVPGVGPVWAARLQKWLNENGIEPTPAEVSANANQLLPLERYVSIPVAVDTTAELIPLGMTQSVTGYKRGSNVIGAMDDKGAIEIWLRAKASNPNTLRSYRKNAERLLLWCHHERKRSFHELTVEDCIHYRTWLSDIGRKTHEEWGQAGWKIQMEEWIGPRAAKRDSIEWRPFDGPLSPKSVVQDLLTVRSFFEYLLKARIIEVNPWDMLGKRLRTRAKLEGATQQFTGRSFSEKLFGIALEGLSTEGSEAERRLLLILNLGFLCGLRASEMLSLTLGSVFIAGERWSLRVIGKGEKVRYVPLPSPVRAALIAYLSSVEVSVDALLSASTTLDPVEADKPVLRSQYGRRSESREAPSSPLRYARLYGILKSHLAVCADRLSAHDPVGSAKFRLGSTHWLRHTCATLALKNGVPLPAVQKLLGHSDLTVTSTYLTHDDDALQDSMELFAGNMREKTNS